MDKLYKAQAESLKHTRIIKQPMQFILIWIELNAFDKKHGFRRML